MTVGDTLPWFELPSSHNFKCSTYNFNQHIPLTSCCWKRSVYLPRPSLLKSSARSSLGDQYDLFGTRAPSIWLLTLSPYSGPKEWKIIYSNIFQWNKCNSKILKYACILYIDLCIKCFTWPVLQSSVKFRAFNLGYLYHAVCGSCSNVFLFYDHFY